MKTETLLMTGAVVFLLQISTAVQAFECPAHFAEAQSAIDKVGAAMKAMDGRVSKEQMALVHALLDDAKMQLHGARHNHEKPQGAYDHARSMAKADAALGYANAAAQLHRVYLK